MHGINLVMGKIKYFDTNSLFEHNFARSTASTTSTSASDDDDTDYSVLFSDTSPQLSLFGIHKIISARFVFSKFNEFIYLPSKSNSTMIFYFLTVLKDGFVKIDCDGVINTKDSSISSTLVVGKYNLEEEKVVWAAKQEIQYFFGKPFAYVTEKDEIIVSCNIKDDQGIFSKKFFSVDGVSTKGPSFVNINTAREVNIVMEGTIDRFSTLSRTNQTSEGFLIFGAKNMRKLNSIYDSKKETLHLETSVMSSFYADGSPKWNVKLVYGNIEFFELLSVKVVSLSNTTTPIVTCINYVGAGSLKTFDSSTDDFVMQTQTGFGNTNFRLYSKYFTAGVYSISATGVFSELFSLRAYPTTDSTSANILVKGFYYDKDKKLYILLIYLKGYLAFSKSSHGGSTMEGDIIYTSKNKTGDYLIVKYTEGSSPVCVPTSYIGDDSIMTTNYFINKRIAIESSSRSKLHLEVMDTETGSIKDNLAIDIQSEDPYGIQYELFYEKRRYLIVRGTTQNNGTILINNKFNVTASTGQSELVFVLYLNTHPESKKYDLQCDQHLYCRAAANDKICKAHGTCSIDQKCECDEFYMGEFCETYYRDTFIAIMVTIGVILITLTGSVLTAIGMYAYRTITKRLDRLKSKVKAEQELEQKLLEFVGLTINETTFNFKSWLIPFEQITFDREIASSSGRTIFQGSWKGTSVAIKKVRLEDSFDYHEETKELNLDKTLEREAAILSRVRHPNILRFWGLAFTHSEQFLVTELFNLSLDQIIEEARKGDLYIPILCKLQILHDVACSITYLHEFDPPILHRNLKPSNIMLSEDVRYGGILSAVKPKIADFGLSTHLRDDNVLTMQIGNVLYSDPLIFKGERYSEKCDVYSFSMIMYEILFETEPYKSSKKVGEIKENYNQYSVLPNKISEGYRPKIPFTKTLESIGDWMETNLELINERIIDPENLAKCIQSYSELMKKCWSGDQNERPSFREIQGVLYQTIRAMQIK